MPTATYLAWPETAEYEGLRTLFTPRFPVLCLPMQQGGSAWGVLYFELTSDTLLEHQAEYVLPLIESICLAQSMRLAAQAETRRQRVFDVLLQQLSQRLVTVENTQQVQLIGTELIGPTLGATITFGSETRSSPVACASRLSLPLHLGGEHLGNLEITRGERQFRPDEQTFAQQCAVLLASAMQRIRQVQAANELQTALQNAYAAASEAARLRTLGLLAAGIAHDFNNLLTAMMGRVQLLELDASPEQLPDLQLIQRAAETGAASVRRIQSFARPQTPSYEPLDLALVAADALDFAHAVAVPRFRSNYEQIRMVNHLSALPPALGDDALLRDVFLNLILNSADAMPHGGTLTLESGSDGAYVWVAVSDTGVGIPLEHQERVFEPFVSTKSSRGYGLGLAMVRQTVHAHNGLIRMESTPQVGTTMTVLLPRAPASLAVTDPTTHLMPAPRRVLLAATNALVRSTLVRLLQADQHSVTAVATADEARTLIAYTSFDIVIASESLPDEPGGQLLQELRASGVAVSTALITDGPLHTRGHEAIDTFVATPVTLTALRQALNVPPPTNLPATRACGA
ncbi:MAG: ATP-binding protein [Chloroflexaceae bacterium]|nr:ATP-binding protein [Chloroflexaceae bacterium]